MTNDSPTDFWRDKALSEMNREEWEKLCDGCGRCCLQKLIDDDTDELVFTSLACRELDLNNGRCRHYATRKARVDDCLVMSPKMDEEIYEWLPDTCAYRLLWQGDDLPSWHPLISGSRKTVRLSHVSVLEFAISETLAAHDDPEDYVIELPKPESP